MRFPLPLRLDDIRLRSKMLIIYICCVLLPIVLTNVIFYQATTKNVKNQRLQDISRALEQVRNDFRAELDAAVRVSDAFISDYILYNILEAEYEGPLDYIEAYDSYLRKILNSYTPLYASLQNIKIYLDNPTMMHSGAIGRLTPEVRESDWYRELSAASGSTPVLLRTVREHAILPAEQVRDTFVIVRRMENFVFLRSNKWEKILKIELRPQAVEQAFSNLNLPGHLYLIDESGQVEYTTNPEIDWRTETVYYHELARPEDAIEFETDYSSTAFLDGWRLIGVIPEEEVLREVRESRDFIVWLALFNLLFSTVIIYWVTRSMNVRLVSILRHMNKVKNQQFVPIAGRETLDEIGQLQNAFNRMTLQIKSLIHDVYIADIRQKSLEIERRKAQFNALQSQINPHFLFNSLETIRMRSLIKNETETAQIIHKMAKLLRSSLTWSRDMIRVEEELEFIDCFLEIQKYRFGDRLAFRIEVDPEARDLVIPKLVFLPFVENASIHGIEPMKRGGEIDIAIRRRDRGLEFSIRDNGVGMRSEQVKRFYGYLENETEELGERIGVQNVLYRLRMLYGDSIRLFIDSAPGRGTHIRITLPLRRETDGPAEPRPES
jgi:two-component system sensor histidine kinase YesM